MASLRLAVQACKSEDVGMNLIFLAYPDFCVLAGGEGQQESVRVLVEESTIFFVRISMAVQRGTIGMDGVQRSMMQLALHDRVTVRVWEGPETPIRRLHLTVDLPSSSSKRQTQIDAAELVRTVRRSFADNVLHPRQYLLAVAGGAQLRLRVIGVETPSMDLAVALAMALHARLGSGSGLKVLKSTHLSAIATLALGPTAAGQNCVMTRDTVIECKAQPNSPVNLRRQVRTMFFDKKAPQATASRALITKRTPSPTEDNRNDGDTDSVDSSADVSHTSGGSKITTCGLSLSENSEGQVIVNDALFVDLDQQLLVGDVIESVNGQNVHLRCGARQVEQMTKLQSGTFITFGIIRSGHRSFVTLERDHLIPQHHHRPAALFSGSPSHTHRSRDEDHARKAHPASDASRNHSLSPVLSASTDTDCHSTSIRQRSDTPPEPWLGRVAFASSSSSPNAKGHQNGAGAQSEVRAGIEELTMENEGLRDALSAQQKRIAEQAQLIMQERGRVQLAEQLATGLESQLQLVQHHIQGLVQEVREQSSRERHLWQRLEASENEVVLLRDELERSAEQHSPQGQARDSIVRLEEMVETLLHLGEQESTMLQRDLKVQNQDLKYILAQLQRAELAQGGLSTGKPRTSNFSTDSSLISHSRPNCNHESLTRLSSHPVCGVSEKGLASLSSSLHHISYSSGEAPSGNLSSRGVLYTSLSEATASLRSTSPDLEPLTACMSPFVMKAPARTWEETISLLSASRDDKRSALKALNSAHRDPRHSRQSMPLSLTPGEVREEVPRQARMSASHLTWEEAMNGYSRLTTNNLKTPERPRRSKSHDSPVSVLDSSLDESSKPEKRHRSSLAQSSSSWRATEDSIAGNFLTSDQVNQTMHRNKFVPAVFGGEHWEEEQTPCLWAGRQAGIHENAVAAVHKLLLKGKTYGQVAKNHTLAHFSLEENMIHDYIRYCIEFASTSLGRKPHWVLQYMQKEPQPQLQSPSPKPVRRAPPGVHTIQTAGPDEVPQVKIEARKPSAPTRASRTAQVSNKDGAEVAHSATSASADVARTAFGSDGLDGYIGLQLDGSRLVVAVKDMMDRNSRLQGEIGYSNPVVRPGDELTQIHGMPLVGKSLDDIHTLLRGPRGSLVDLTLSNSSGVFSVSVIRHAAHEFEGPRSPNAIPRMDEQA